MKRRLDAEPEWRPSVTIDQLHTGLAGAVDPRALSPDQWVRVVPMGLERARAMMDWDDDDDGGRRLLRLVVDYKLLSADPVLDPSGSPELVVSEAVVATLHDLQVRGWRAEPVEHVSPLRPRVPAAYRLAISGRPFTFVSGLDPSNTPRGGVTLRAESANPSIAWTPWLGPSRSWRALIVNGGVIRALCERIGPHHPLPHVVPVQVTGDFDAATIVPSSWQRAAGADPAPPVEVTWAQLGAALTIAHPPPSNGIQEEVLRNLGLQPTNPLCQLMERCDGAALFGGALVLFPQTQRALTGVGFEARSIEEENSPRMLASSGLVLPAATCLFARSHEGDIFWGICGDRVFGFGRGAPPFGGYRYGYGQTLGEWLADFVGDLRFEAAGQ
jgi:hypothetical protein